MEGVSDCRIRFWGDHGESHLEGTDVKCGIVT